MTLVSSRVYRPPKSLRMLLVVVLSTVLVLWQMPVRTLAANDTTPPVFQSLSVTPNPVLAGNTVTISAHITDGDSGVSGTNRPYISYTGPGGQYLSTSFSFISGSPQDGVWQALLTIPSAYPSGTYAVNGLGAYDNAGNNTYIYPPTP